MWLVGWGGVVELGGSECDCRGLEFELLVRYIIMPNIINEVKLDFKDVLLRPKRSTLRSRADVSLYHDRNTCSSPLLPIYNRDATDYDCCLYRLIYIER